MNIVNDLNWRYATKKFNANKKVSAEDLEIILEAFRLSASAFGLQPWKLFVVENQEVKDSLVIHTWNQKQVADCSQLLVLARLDKVEESNISNHIEKTMEVRNMSAEQLQGYKERILGYMLHKTEQEKIVWMKEQIYIALGNLLTVCAELKIDSCPIAGFIPEKYNEILGLKEKGYFAEVLLPIGYRAEDDAYANAEKVRFDKEDIIEFIK